MEVVENTLAEPLDAVLSKPLFCFLGTLSGTGEPRISPLWYLWEDETVWIIADSERTYTTRVADHPRTALAIVDFDVETGRVVHVGMRGTASVEALDPDRVDRLLGRYLGPETTDWDPRFAGLDSDRWRLIRFEPETVVARDQSFTPSLGPDSA
ncbi:MAG: pyridoxamine 5'-phosphate oxidase family protein [Halobacteriaceae archaeon]